MNGRWGTVCNNSSTSSALVQVLDDWCKAIDCNHEVGIVFFDVRKAFDSVPHIQLLRLLHSLRLNEYLLQWIRSYLLSRSQYVVVDGQESSPLQVMSGVPQGSVLGPQLFITYINDITKEISPGTSINMFADDIAMYRVIKSPDDYTQLQIDIDSIASFMDRKSLQFNSTKCKFMLVSRRTSCSVDPPSLTLHGSVLQRVYSYKYLGVNISSSLSWKEHVSVICKKTKRQIGLLHRRFSKAVSPEIMLKLYKAFIRPCMEYAATAWSPYLRGEVEQLEKVQRFALRVCLKIWDKSVPYDTLLELSKVHSLEFRRKVGRLLLLFKILNNLTYYPGNDIFQSREVLHSTRFVNQNSLSPIACRTAVYQNSFMPAVIELWNMFVGRVNVMDCNSVEFLTLLYMHL